MCNHGYVKSLEKNGHADKTRKIDNLKNRRDQSTAAARVKGNVFKPRGSRKPKASTPQFIRRKSSLAGRFKDWPGQTLFDRDNKLYVSHQKPSTTTKGIQSIGPIVRN